MWGSDQRRHIVARQSWEREYGTRLWVAVPVVDTQLRRSSKTAMRDPRTLPFLRDLLDFALRQATDADLIVFTNDDVVFAPGLTDSLYHVEHCAWASRHEFTRLPTLPTCLDIIGARKHCGCDLFAMTPDWWRTNRSDYPDMLVACEAVDLILRNLMRETGGVELHGALAHEEHIGHWQRNRSDPGARHNRRLAEQWLAKRGITSWL